MYLRDVVVEVLVDVVIADVLVKFSTVVLVHMVVSVGVPLDVTNVCII